MSACDFKTLKAEGKKKGIFKAGMLRFRGSVYPQTRYFKWWSAFPSPPS